MNQLLIARFRFCAFVVACAFALLAFAGPASADFVDPDLTTNGSACTGNGTPVFFCGGASTLGLDPVTRYTTLEYTFSPTYGSDELAAGNVQTGAILFEYSGTPEAEVDIETSGGDTVVYVYNPTDGLPTISGAVVQNTCVSATQCEEYPVNTNFVSGVVGYNKYGQIAVTDDGTAPGQTTLASQPEPSSLSALAIGLLSVGLCYWAMRKRETQDVA